MSNTNYDIEFQITYDPTYKHYLTNYDLDIPDYKLTANTVELIAGVRETTYTRYYAAMVSFDEGNEINVSYQWEGKEVWSASYSRGSSHPTLPFWNSIPESGFYSKCYVRNPNRSQVSFTSSNTHFRVTYKTKAAFEIQFNLTGFAAGTNAFFKCSTVQKNTYAQYTWESATVYYKESSASTYQSTTGTISGTWSDYTISTDLSFSDNVTYDIYITAVSDDGSTASTPVSQFTTEDAAAVSTCIAPSGAFTTGEVTFIWSHATAYGTPQYAYDLQYSDNNGSSWTPVASHVVSQSSTTTATITSAGVYIWRVRTYNSNDVAGEWATAAFVNNVPAIPPTNLVVNTKGRPTVEWASVSQSAYQVQALLNDNVIYNSGAVYTTETRHFVNVYFDDTKSYTFRVRIYNALGEVSDWTATGYQQPPVNDIEMRLENNEEGGAIISAKEQLFYENDVEGIKKFYLLRNNKPIALITEGQYIDRFAVGPTSYSVVGVTEDDQSDIKTMSLDVKYPHATIITRDGQAFLVNKRVERAFEIQTSNEADINKANFIGDSLPTHYPGQLRTKVFTVSFFDDHGIVNGLLGSLVYYADNFGNGGWCMVSSYDKKDSFIKDDRGNFANEVTLTLEVTKYDDSIEYPI